MNALAIVGARKAIASVRLAFSIVLLAALSAVAGEPASRRVVVVVWDGMRPDFVSAETTPNLWKLAAAGVTFSRHHPVYLSSTEVNGTAMATGAYPEHSFVIANADFRPRIDPQNLIGVESPVAIRRGDSVSGGHYLGTPTVAEMLHARGWATAIAGSKQVVLLHDRAARAEKASSFPVVYEGEAMPRLLMPVLDRALGKFPNNPAARDSGARDAWTTGALIDVLWRDGVPPYSLLWLAEPDYCQHYFSPGSPEALAAIRGSDANLGRVVAALEARGAAGETDILVVSDHGFSTTDRRFDLAVELSSAGFNSTRAALGGLRKGQVMVAGNGGSSLLYVGGHDPEVCRRLAAYLQSRDWTGVVFSKGGLEGTFPLSEALIDSPEAPDLVVSFQWTDGTNAAGTPGLQASDLPPSSKKKGNHASLSLYDMHNTLIAAGPDFRLGFTDTLASGNTDVAPTILWILGLRKEAASRDGRVLFEALSGGEPPPGEVQTRRISASCKTPGGVWSQYLQISEVAGVRYLDQGNGRFSPGP